MQITKKQACWLYNQIVQEHGQNVFINGAGEIVIEYHDYDKTKEKGFMPYFFDGTGTMPCKLQKENFRIVFYQSQSEAIRSRALQADKDTAKEINTIRLELQKIITFIAQDNYSVKEYLKG